MTVIGFSFAACGDDGGTGGGGTDGDGTDGDGTAPKITTTSLPGGTVGVAYNKTLEATGDEPVTWSVSIGALPAGLTLQSDTISGTPTAARTSTFTVKATNSTGSDTKSLSITIAPAGGGGGGTAPKITTASLPGGTVGTAYNEMLAATGDGPITWSVSVGTLPAGLNLATGTITGTPTTEGMSTFTVKATNAAGSDTKQLSITIDNPSSIVMVQIPNGTFTMGSPANEPERYGDETQHSVTLTGFYMSKYQVTQEQFETVTGNNPSNFKTPVPPETSTANRPVETVTWYDAIVFCNMLSMSESLSPAYEMPTADNYGVWNTDPATWGEIPTDDDMVRWNMARVKTGSTGYRLPTEAQWEYACRAGTITAYNTGDTISDDTGWYNGNSGGRTHTVGEKRVNAWGLYDMHGNVLEWCWDWYSLNYYSSSPAQDPTGPDTGGGRVVRGGSYAGSSRNLRSAYRDSVDPSRGSVYYGFRIVRPAE
jgi:formylglycine-generating enzyme required for sulfatase activity